MDNIFLRSAESTILEATLSMIWNLVSLIGAHEFSNVDRILLFYTKTDHISHFLFHTAMAKQACFAHRPEEAQASVEIRDVFGIDKNKILEEDGVPSQRDSPVVLLERIELKNLPSLKDSNWSKSAIGRKRSYSGYRRV